MNFDSGLTREAVDKIWRALSKYAEIESAILYGSRATGRYKLGSDIDLALKGRGLDLPTVSRLGLDLDDLMLPYLFDVSIYVAGGTSPRCFGQGGRHIENSDLINHIDEYGVQFYPEGSWGRIRAV